MSRLTSPRPRIGVAIDEPLRSTLFDTGRAARLSRIGTPQELGPPANLERSLSDVEILVTGWMPPPLTAQVLDRAPSLRLVAHIGADTTAFVTPELHRRGVLVVQAGQGMARSVAEVALTFTLSLLHRVNRFDRSLRFGQAWASATKAPDRHEILGCIIGVIGASRVGRSYIEMVRSLGARVLVTDPYLSELDARQLGIEKADLPNLMRRSRIISVHAPSTPETRHLLGAAELALMQDGAALVNTARSALVDQHALLEELGSGRIDAALDVFDDEPLPVDHPYRALHNVLLTPHQAAATIEGRHRQADIILDELENYTAGRPLQHPVNDASISRA